MGGIYSSLDQFSGITTLPVSVADGGTGRSSLTDGAVLVGDGTNPVTLVGPLTDGQLLIGDTAGIDPVAASLTAPAAGITITGGAGSITFALSDDLLALENLGTTGIAARTAADTWALRTITENSTGISITNGDGVSGNPTIGINEFVRSATGRFENIGFSYSSPTFTVHSSDGTAFSSTNPGYVCLPDRTNFGQTVVYRITANQDFIDATGASEIIGNLFGFTTSVAVVASVPFFLYACTNDAQDTITFGISRIPHLKNAPPIANLGSPSSATADIEASIFLLEDVTLGDYDGNPVFSIGSFRMTMNASDDWTVQALDTQDGIGNFNENRIFTGYLGQFGANAGTYTINNGGTAPTFTDIGQQYSITRDGYCYLHTSLRNDGGADGAGAVAAQIAIPFEVDNMITGLGGQLKDTALIYRNGGANEISPLYYLANSHTVQFYRLGTTINDLYEWQDFGNGNRTIAFSSIYKIDNAG